MGSSTHGPPYGAKSGFPCGKSGARLARHISMSWPGTARRRLINNYAILLQRYHRASERAAESREASRHGSLERFAQGLELAELDGSFGPDRADRPAEQPKRNFGGKFSPVGAVQLDPPGIRRQ